MLFLLRWTINRSVIIFIIMKLIICIIITDGIDINNNNKSKNHQHLINHHDYYDNDNTNNNCYLPNQNDKGNCIVISECKAYLKIRNFTTDLTPRIINFLKQVQCTSEYNILNNINNNTNTNNNNNDSKEAKVCCPLNNIDYKLPQIEFSTNINHRGRILVGGDLKYKNKKFKKRIYKIYNTSALSLDNECGKQITNRIYGGEIAELDEYPWLALIFYNSNEFGCSGALINNRYILTAAHCVTGPIVREKKGLKYVRLGEFNVKTQPDCIEEINYINCADASVDIGIDDYYVHPKYNEKSINKFNDIALIKLKKYVTFTHFIMPICLPKKDDKDNPLIPGKYFSVSGWGKTDLFNKFFLNIRSPIKLKLRVPIVSYDNCSEILSRYGATLGSKQICAGGEFAKDTCAGDSGGPLMHFDIKHSRWITYGIVSYGFTQCGLAGHPAVYTNVIEYIDWIHDKIIEKN